MCTRMANARACVGVWGGSRGAGQLRGCVGVTVTSGLATSECACVCRVSGDWRVVGVRLCTRMANARACVR